MTIFVLIISHCIESMSLRLTFILAGLLFIGTIAAQPFPLDKTTNLLRDGDIVHKQELSYKHPGRSGANVIWDFSTLTALDDGVEETFSVSDESLLTAHTSHANNHFYLRGDSLFCMGYDTRLLHISYLAPELCLTFPFSYEDYGEDNGVPVFVYDTKYPLLVAGEKRVVENAPIIPAPSPHSTEWLLSAFTIPTGGKTTFTYEQHELPERETVFYEISKQDSIIIHTTTEKFQTIPNDGGHLYLNLECTYQCPTSMMSSPIINPSLNFAVDNLSYTSSDPRRSAQGHTILSVTGGATYNCVGIPNDAVVFPKGSAAYFWTTYSFSKILPIDPSISDIQIHLSSVSGAMMTVKATLSTGQYIQKKLYVGGIRVKDIHSPTSTKHFTYTLDSGKSSLVLTRDPLFTEYQQNSRTEDKEISQRIEYRSYPCSPMENLATGQSVGYSQVNVITDDDEVGAKESYYFHNDPEGTLTTGKRSITFPLNGKTRRYVAYADTIPVIEKSYAYGHVSPSIFIDKINTFSLESGEKYQIQSNFYPLTSLIEKERGSILADTTHYTTLTTYGYNRKYLLEQVTMKAQGEKEQIIEMLYSSDMPMILSDGTPINLNNWFPAISDTARLERWKLYHGLNNHNFVHLPVVITKKVDGTLQEKTLYSYTDSITARLQAAYTFLNRSGVNLPDEYETIPNGTLPDKAYSYNMHGRPVCTYTRTGQPSITLWGYNNLYVIAQVEGATLQELVNCGINIEELSISLHPTSTNSWTKLQNLNQYIPCAQVTLMEYDPLIGLIKKTFPSGIASEFYYDTFNRISTEYEVAPDGVRTLIRKHEYKYAGEH